MRIVRVRPAYCVYVVHRIQGRRRDAPVTDQYRSPCTCAMRIGYRAAARGPDCAYVEYHSVSRPATLSCHHAVPPRSAVSSCAMPCRAIMPRHRMLPPRHRHAKLYHASAVPCQWRRRASPRCAITPGRGTLGCSSTRCDERHNAMLPCHAVPPRCAVPVQWRRPLGEHAMPVWSRFGHTLDTRDQ